MKVRYRRRDTVRRRWRDGRFRQVIAIHNDHNTGWRFVAEIVDGRTGNIRTLDTALWEITGADT